MKKIIINMLLLVALGFTSEAFAQNTFKKSDKDGYLRQNGKIIGIRDGKAYAVTRDVALADGVTLLTNGTLVRRDGARYNLEEGQAVDGLGQILYPRRDRDGNIILLPRRGDEDYDRNHRVGKGKQNRQGPPYGNAYGYYKNKEKKYKKDKEYKKDDRDRNDRWKDRNDD